MNANDLFKSIMELDLEPIKTKLMHAASGEGWSRDKTDAVEKEYRRFLCLMRLYPNEPTAPLVDVDTFWHYHILDTMKYAVDCENAFGYFLHHYPYVGMGGEDDQQLRLHSGERLRELYEATFGDAYPAAGDDVDQRAQIPTIKIDFSYCGGPFPHKPFTSGKAGGGETAYCGGPFPHKPLMPSDAINAKTAYCDGPFPHKPVTDGKAPGAQTAYCGGPFPHKPLMPSDAINAKAAYCGGPFPHEPVIGRNASGTQTAYCGGPFPHKPAPVDSVGKYPVTHA